MGWADGPPPRAYRRRQRHGRSVARDLPHGRQPRARGSSTMGTTEGNNGAVVAGTDGSDHATRAVRWAAEEAELSGRPLLIVYATATRPQALYLSPQDIREMNRFAEDVLAQAAALARGLAPTARVTTRVCDGRAAACLLAEAGPGTLLVVGSRGRGGFASLLVGSDSLRVAAQSPVPVTVVPGGPEHGRTGVVLAAARDARDEETLRTAASLAARRGATLEVVSAWVLFENVGSMATMFSGADLDRIASDQAAATSRLAALAREQQPGLTVTERVTRATSVAEALVTGSVHADMIVLGARRRALPVGSALGGVTHAVLHHAQCPVVLVPHA
ncbi:MULTISPECIES: universal stress protein [Streptomyces]|nr:universal stress protein [Streptomyces fungicidicus]PAX83353.1 universal stress protein UspA [Streptomyces albidoflavus]PAX92349.1 universal stress protein UspA [Streptomyces albidoflavus]PBO16186.1 universal stress protein UspA [Streptomyces albidoflavus]PBO25883.1 universal stress protein UspA [Streptomyces albidoflavus]PBO30529.1 universal stress protein UspA [Streptomyces albidoflavus]